MISADNNCVCNSLVIDDVYVLNSLYYQKLGEVWDHETKDFKVLYKPLYCCSSKAGSYEAHHLATSTFERWNRKFIPVTNCAVESLPEEIRRHIVSSSSIREMSAGHDSLPLLSTALPTSMQKGSTRVTTLVDVPPSSSLGGCKCHRSLQQSNLSQ